MTIQEIKELFGVIKMIKDEMDVSDGFTALTILKEIGYKDAQWEEEKEFAKQANIVKLILGQFPRQDEL